MTLNDLLCASCGHSFRFHIHGLFVAVPCDYEMNLAPKESRYCGCPRFEMVEEDKKAQAESFVCGNLEIDR